MGCINREKFYKIIEGILLLYDSNEFKLINLDYTDKEIEICKEIFDKVVTKELK